ncbi:methyltransferase family protein [Pseudoalteromonas sp. T1lg24]|uniref:methyltransferase family protein n=1 Tax=Pseudoalteromonas sp. T1lg24 TaxID=2077099 RepID=UPI000CF6869E
MALPGLNTKQTAAEIDSKGQHALITSGIFQYTRNPMYLGMALAILGFAILLGSWLSLLGVVAFMLFIECFQIKPEEAALTECFGEQFIQYKKHVRRWL